MEQLNKTPTTGKFGDVAKTIDTNFGLIVTKLMELSEASKAKKMNCGFYSSETELKTAYSNPDKGMMAYVGSGIDYTVYRCKTDGKWTATSETFKVNISVDLSTYATKDALAQVKGSVDNLLLGAVYGGIAARTTNPGSPKNKVFYLPTEVGEYPNFGNLSVAANEIAFLYYDGTKWTKQSVDFSNDFNDINDKLSDLSKYFNDKLSNLQDVHFHLDKVTTDADYSEGYINSRGNLVVSGSFKSLYRYDISAYDKLFLMDKAGSAAHTILYNADGQVVLSTNKQQAFRVIDVKKLNAVSLSSTEGVIYRFVSGKRLDIHYRLGYMGSNGTIVNANHLKVYITDFIPVSDGDKFLYVGSAMSSARGFASFDEAGNLVESRTTTCSVPLYIEINERISFVRFASNDAPMKVHYVSGMENITGKWLALGTSRTWYNESYRFAGNLGLPLFYQGYQSCLMERIQFASYVNGGVNGGSIKSALDKVEAADYVTIEHGVNDNNNKYGTIEDFKNKTDNGTFAANFRKLVDAIYNANPYAKIVVITPTHYTDNGYLKQIAELERDICKEMSIPCADCYTESGVNPSNASLYAIDSGLHPNQNGYRLIANLLYNALKKVIINNEYECTFNVANMSGNILEGVDVTLKNKYTGTTNTFTSLPSSEDLGYSRLKLSHGIYEVTVGEGYTVDSSSANIEISCQGTFTIKVSAV